MISKFETFGCRLGDLHQFKSCKLMLVQKSDRALAWALPGSPLARDFAESREARADALALAEAKRITENVGKALVAAGLVKP